MQCLEIKEIDDRTAKIEIPGTRSIDFQLKNILLINGSILVWLDSHGSALLYCRVSDPDPDWIRIQSGHWILIQSGQWIRIRIRNPDPDPGGQK
jgi:hypothetical protein